MSLADLVKEIGYILPPSVAHVMEEIAKEVDAHKQAISDLAAVGGPVAETVATGVEEVAAQVESPQAATPVPSVTSIAGEASPIDTPPVEGSGHPGAADPNPNPLDNPPYKSGESLTVEQRLDRLEQMGNLEQTVPHEDRVPKA